MQAAFCRQDSSRFALHAFSGHSLTGTDRQRNSGADPIEISFVYRLSSRSSSNIEIQIMTHFDLPPAPVVMSW